MRSGASPDPGAVVARRSLIAALGALVLLAPLSRPALAQPAGSPAAWAAGLHDVPVLSELDGSPLLLQRNLWRPLLLNLWASWCAPCLAEMPALAALRDILGRHGSGQIEVVGLNAGLSINQVDQFLLKRPLRLPIVLDPHKHALDRALAAGTGSAAVRGPQARRAGS